MKEFAGNPKIAIIFAGINDTADLILVSNYHNVHETAGKQKLIAPHDVIMWTESNSRVPVVGMGAFLVEERGMFAVGASGFEQGEVAVRMAIELLDRGAILKNIAQVMPRQFLVCIRAPLMAEHQISLPPIYEAFARAANNYYE